MDPLQALMGEEDGEEVEYVWNMTNEEREKRLTWLRPAIHALTYVHALYLVLRTMWHSVPFMLGEPPLTQATPWIALGGAACLVLHRYAFGFGRPEAERERLQQLYFAGIYLWAAQCGLACYGYHVLWPKHQLYPQMLARHDSGGWSADKIKQVAQVFEVAMDIGGIVSLAASALFTRELCVLKREARKEAEQNARKAARAAQAAAAAAATEGEEEEQARKGREEKKDD